mmetsp:Transcript_9168/g.13373  ORF Transcript_9168/g.13373 Transcript_9168/m.13373 type:complete len:544 (-) Transcript_9168:1398-3029(-)|eukprot:CAMPEP_0194058308 /NCGR_PEP_ID=MMETSP0009_2-20130614/65905_1 /TAXON_ID=210454 /ORGANISM="Grammatophora oceanica, Strain CCMP 410" /LENGTH=543 /DNA_ID=CAMNT_0038708405 /DNA_START=134 /DNA_END=1765 /DNA_ORIENTATION=+
MQPRKHLSLTSSLSSLFLLILLSRYEQVKGASSPFSIQDGFCRSPQHSGGNRQATCLADRLHLSIPRGGDSSSNASNTSKDLPRGGSGASREKKKRASRAIKTLEEDDDRNEPSLIVIELEEGDLSNLSRRRRQQQPGTPPSALVFNLVKTIVGAGVLGIPAGIAAFGNAPSAIWPGIGLIALMGTLSCYGFSAVGRICAYTGATSYGEAWSKSVGEKTKWVPALCCLLVTLQSVLAYSMILADSVPSLLATAGIGGVTRTQSLVGVTVSALLPLCLLKSLSSLAPFSLVGILGMLYTSLAMLWRYLGSDYAVGGQFHQAIDVKPSFGTTGAAGVLHPNAFLLLSMLSTSYMAHYNAPSFYHELRNPSIKKFHQVVGYSFAISVGIMAGFASIAFLTFGQACGGLVLNNYANQDTLMSVGRVAVAVSLVFSYPLVFQGFRDGLLNFLNVPDNKRTPQLLDGLTVGLLALVTLMAHVIRNLTIVFALGGATVGNALIYILPAFMIVKMAQDGQRKELQKEVPVASMIGGLGLVMAVIGTLQALL